MHKPDSNDLDLCDQLPEWSTGYAHGEYVLGAQLPTRDGRRCGNAHIIAADPAKWDEAKTVYTCLTDAGQQTRLTKPELEEMFFPPQWLSDIAEVKRKFGAQPQISPIAMSFVPADWRMIEKDTHYVLLQRNEVVATLAGPNAETNAATLAIVLSGITHDADQQPAEVPNE